MMKKLIALILILALTLSFGTAAWASEGGTPWIDSDAPVNRAMTVNLLWIMAGQPVVNYALDFDDVPEDASYLEALRWAVSEDIVGESDTKTFGPEEPISREQFAVMLYRYAQKHGLGFTGTWMFPLDYSDAGDVSVWADEAVHWMVMNGIMEGVDGKLEPAGQVTRSDILRMTSAYICGAGVASVAYRQIWLGTSPFSIRIPGSYISRELMPMEVAIGIVAYYNSDFSGMGFDILQISKEGEPELLADYAEKDAAENGAIAEIVEINGISVALYYAVEAFKGEDCIPLTAIIDAGTDYLELIFWTKDLFTDFEAHSILRTLTSGNMAEMIVGRWMLAEM